MPPEVPLQPGIVCIATLTASTAAAKAKAAAASTMSRAGSGEGSINNAPSTPSSWSLGALFQSSGGGSGGSSEVDLRTMRNR